ncbi:gamma-D-glutamyl-L-lysine dipeptidyl-peptidase [soil metagenome]
MRREVSVPVTTVWTSPEAPRDLDALAVADRPDPQGWADSMGQEVRLGLHGRTETQLLLGDPVDVLDERDGWSHVVAPAQSSSRDDRGYPGWVRSAHLAAPVPDRAERSATVVDPSVGLTVDGTRVELSFGTRLKVASVDEQNATLHLPGGRSGTVPLAAVRLGEEPRPFEDADRLLEAARQFLGIRYLWGGTSAWGLDCSGLVHLTFRSFDVPLPRDAHDQAAAAQVHDVPLADVRPGDLYFFARPGRRIYHVGFVSRPVADDGLRWMLHAPEGGELIEDAALAPHRVEDLVSAGRVHSPARVDD